MGRECDLVRWIFPWYEQTYMRLIAVSINWLRAAVFVFTIAVYLTVTIPALKAVVNPAEADPEFTLDQNLGLLGAGNAIIAGLLVLVLVLQARHTIADRTANEAECFSRSGRTRVREARRSQRASRRREGEDQGSEVAVDGCRIVSIHFYLSTVVVHDPHALSLRSGSTAAVVVFFETDRDRRAAVCRPGRNEGGNVGFQSYRGSDSGISNTRVP
jgi:hypothetical protein